MKETSIFLCGEISADNIEPVVDRILLENDLGESDLIKLFIDSPGGAAYDAFALIDVIMQSKIPVHTICVGGCMSAALMIWLAGHKRLIGHHATLMYHDVGTSVNDYTSGLQQELNEIVRLQQIQNDFILRRSKVDEATLRHYIDHRSDWYISAFDAVKLKLADGFYTK